MSMWPVALSRRVHTQQCSFSPSFLPKSDCCYNSSFLVPRYVEIPIHDGSDSSRQQRIVVANHISEPSSLVLGYIFRIGLHPGVFARPFSPFVLVLTTFLVLSTSINALPSTQGCNLRSSSSHIRLVRGAGRGQQSFSHWWWFTS